MTDRDRNAMEGYAAVVRALADALPEAVAIYLFGSHASGDFGPTSDLDLAVLASGPIAPERLARVRAELAEAVVVLNKAAIVERCLARVREVHAGNDANLIDDPTRQDSILLNPSVPARRASTSRSDHRPYRAGKIGRQQTHLLEQNKRLSALLGQPEATLAHDVSGRWWQPRARIARAPASRCARRRGASCDAIAATPAISSLLERGRRRPPV